MLGGSSESILALMYAPSGGQKDTLYEASVKFFTSAFIRKLCSLFPINNTFLLKGKLQPSDYNIIHHSVIFFKEKLRKTQKLQNHAKRGIIGI